MTTVEKLKELAAEHGLSPETTAFLERVFLNNELDDEDKLSPEELGIEEGMESIPESDRAKFAPVMQELGKFLARQQQEAESWVDLGERALAAIERAQELEPDMEIHSIAQALPVFEKHGLENPFSEEEMNLELEMTEEEAIDAGLIEDMREWITIPASEVPLDENGLPTRKATKHGFGIDDGKGGILKIYPPQLAAMRAISQDYPYKTFVEQHLDRAAQMKQEMLTEVRKEIEPELVRLAKDGDVDLSPENIANMIVGKSLRQVYMLTLATQVQEYRGSPHDIIDYHKGKMTKAAKRYLGFINEKYLHPMMEHEMDQFEEEAVEAGVVEIFTGDDGEEYIKLLDGYEEWMRKRRDQDS
jgi:hypothetical protein